MRRRALLLAGAGALTTACLRRLRTHTAWQSREPGAPLSPLAANPDKGLWPAAVAAAPAKVQEAYKWAPLNEPTLQYIPCYCGCAGQGHRSNFDCYVAEARPNGWLVLTDHALG